MSAAPEGGRADHPVAPRGVHVVTRIQSVLGIVDGSGDVRHQQTFELEIQALTEEAFHDAWQTLVRLRDEAAWPAAEDGGTR